MKKGRRFTAGVFLMTGFIFAAVAWPMFHGSGTGQANQEKQAGASRYQGIRINDFPVAVDKDRIREAELTALCKKNPREIRRMIIGFQDLLREVDTN